MNDLPPELPSNEELNRALERIEALEEFVAENRRKIRDSRALCVAIAFVLPAFLISAEVNIGEKFSANVRSRDVDAGDLISIFSFGAAALGIVGWDEISGLIKQSKD